MNKIKLLNTTLAVSRTLDVLSTIASLAAVASTIYVTFSFIKSTNKNER